MTCQILPIAFDKGASKEGCAKAPEALLSGGLLQSLQAVGQKFELLPFAQLRSYPRSNRPFNDQPRWHDVADMTQTLSDRALAIGARGLPVFIGGDHSISAGTISGMARSAAQYGRPLFVLWLDAHPDFNTIHTTQSGNLHGVPLAYVSGQTGFSPLFPPLGAAVDPERICIMGVRSVDLHEKALLEAANIELHTMPDLNRRGVEPLLSPFLQKVAEANGFLHVSLDIDFIDPQLAGGVGTPVPDGATISQAYEIIDMLAQSRLLSSLDIVEYNPLLDHNQQTLRCVIELTSRLIRAGIRQYPRHAA
jgi:arginase